jgi:hypothetical protein
MIMLFSERPELNQRPYTFLVSMLVHGVVVVLVAFGIISAPRVRTRAAAERFAVRHLDLHTLEAELRQARKDVEYPHSHFIKHTPAERSSKPAPMMRQVVQAPPGPQTLVQPDIPKPITLTQEIPLPTVVIWNGQKTLVKTLVAPQPIKPAVADVHPSLQLPNQEQNLADIALAAANLPAPTLPILPSTTSPVVVPGPKPTPPAPVTNAEGGALPTPAAVMSLSDARMPNGDVSLPPVNESASANSPGAMTPGRANGSSQAGQANSDGKAGDARAGQGSAGADDAAGAAQGAQTGFGQGYQPSTAHITLPISGQFGAVVVGSSLEEKYPETASFWSDRLSYTVYLHVGTAKSWIMQYSLPRANEAAAAGNIMHIEAPWPYSIVRPNLAPGAIDADALMLRGFVNEAGRFQSLAIVFPPQFEQSQFVLDSLAQWQFRPATQNGQNVKVEVLLIIPEEQQ